MSFLAPLFLLGAAGIALPILFHLRRRRPDARVPFSSLMFLQPAQASVRKRSRLENILLLILRCLVLALLAFAFARPFLPESQALGAAQSGKRIAILIDTSASMRREDLAAQALEKAARAVSAAGLEDQVALYVFDSTPRPLVTFREWADTPPSQRPALAQQALNAIVFNGTDTTMGGALIAAAEAIAEAQDEVGGRAESGEIVLIGDAQAGLGLDELRGYSWPENIRVRLDAVAAKDRTNAGVQLVADPAAADSDMPARIRVSNAAESERADFEVRVEGGATARAHVPPGQSRVVRLALPADKPSKIVLTGDAHDFDNEAYFTPPKPQEIDVLFAGADARDDPSGLLYFLSRAFQPTARRIVRVVEAPPGAPLPKTKAGLVVAAGPVAGERVAELRKLLAEGRTILFVMKAPGDAGALAELAGVPGLTAAEHAKDYALLGGIEFTHPIFAVFAEPRFSDFTKINFWKHRALDLAGVEGARVLARFDDGDPALAELPVAKGSLLVLTSGWQPADSQLALSTKFVPLLYSILEQTRGEDAPEASAEEAGPAPQVLDPTETETTPLSPDELAGLGVPIAGSEPKAAAARERDPARELAASIEGRQKLWRWIVLGVLMLVIAETFLAGRLTRPAPAPAT